MTPAGFPHSDIPGSKTVCVSPRLIAAYHVLHRLLVPRHPPCALSSLTGNKLQRCFIVFAQRLNIRLSKIKRNATRRERRRAYECAGREDLYRSMRNLHSADPSLVSGGDSGARTRSLRLAKPALSQLSYIPDPLPRPGRDEGWWAWVDSNHPPHAYQACALTN